MTVVEEGPDARAVEPPASGVHQIGPGKRLSLKVDVPAQAVCPGLNPLDVMACSPEDGDAPEDACPALTLTFTDPAVRAYRAEGATRPPGTFSDRLIGVLSPSRCAGEVKSRCAGQGDVDRMPGMTELPSNAVPAPAVLAAFGVKGPAVPLVGGQGRSVRVGGFVFKPAEGPDNEAEWAASLFEELASCSGFRVPLPLRAADGRSVVDGWTADEFLTGQPGPQGHWSGVLSAGRAFHAALRGVPRPDFLDQQVHPWAVADRVAWGEQAVDVIDDLAVPFSTLLELRRPVRQDEAQLIHGDLTGNVLFAADQVPAVIDFSPYWRPPLFAEAVVVADGLLWFDLPSDLLTAGSGHPDWPQMLVRALIFRLVAHSESAGPPGRAQTGEPNRYARAADVVVRKLATF
ncbi:hypothetical protein [Streptomyces sp. NPDC054863]